MKMPVGITKLWFNFSENSVLRLYEIDIYFKTKISVLYSGHKYKIMKYELIIFLAQDLRVLRSIN